MSELTPEILAAIDVASLLDGLPLGVAVTDQESRVVTLNSALERLTGFSRHEVRGVPCAHVVRSGVCLGGCPCEAGADTDIVNRHRRRIPVRVRSFALPDREGRPLLRLDLVEDLSALREMERRCEESGAVGKLVGKGPVMERILGLMPPLAASDAPVFIIGETGAGKDAVAESLHKLSPRSREAFVRVNCGPGNPQALEAELFGHAGPGGEFAPGAFQRAGAGTLYLSDVGELPENLQAALVHYLDEGFIRPVGAQTDMRAQARLAVSSPVSPEELVRQGRFSSDLAVRLGALRLSLPPLRERREDIEFLLEHFLGVYAAKFKKKVRGFTPKARRILLAHEYPGNVRELRNIVEFSVMICQGETITPACLPAHLLELARQQADKA
ncbi:sigma-54-dependent Fis family transcriptional regulator [Fundidesulfovibrio butyratiphilus]